MFTGLKTRTIVAVLSFFLPVFAQQSGSFFKSSSELKFDRIDARHGLSQSAVDCIYQDRLGFMWFGTRDGLNRYDGYSFDVYKPDIEDTATISDNWIKVIYESPSDPEYLWVGTQSGGLNRFHFRSETFYEYRHDPQDPSSLSSDNIGAIVEDAQGRMWVGTWGGGVHIFDRDTGKFQRFRHDPQDPSSLSDDKVRTMLAGRYGDLWVATKGGLNRATATPGQFERHQHDPKDNSSLSRNWILTLYEDSRGNLWVGTNGGGLNRFNRETRSFTRIQKNSRGAARLSDDAVQAILEDERGNLWIGTREGGLTVLTADGPSWKSTLHLHDTYRLSSLSVDNVYSLFKDRSGAIWAGTNGGGINRLNQRARLFGHVRTEPHRENSLIDNYISVLFEDSKGMLWIGTSDGLDRFDPASGYFQHYQHRPGDRSSLADNSVWSIREDAAGKIWVGTRDGGLSVLDPARERFMRHYKSDPSDDASLSNNWVTALYFDLSDKGRFLWVGTWGGGLNRLDTETGVFRRYQHDSADAGSISDNSLEIIHGDQHQPGILWIGTKNGFNRLDTKSGEFQRFLSDPADRSTLSNNLVTSVYQDRSDPDRLWVGTDDGLNIFSKSSGQFQHLRESDGLVNNVIYGICGDRSGHLWLSTNQGLSRYSVATGTFRNFDVRDGLQSNEFNSHAVYESRHGTLYFGGVNGFNMFHPDSIVSNSYVPETIISHLEIFNATPDKSHWRNYAGIAAADEINIDYLDNILIFQFAALSFKNPERNAYAYKLDGFNENWIDMGSRREATFTNLDPGSYALLVRGANNDGVWNKQATDLRINVAPPWWQTWWAYMLYALVLLAAIMAIVFGYARYRTREQQKTLALQEQKLAQEREVSERLRQVDRLKDEFLANTSHELRTPLNGIIGITESIIDGATGDVGDKTRENLQMVSASGRRLAHLVNDILDFSRLKSHDLTLNRKPIDVRVLAELVIKLSQLLLQGKPLKLDNQLPEDFPAVNADENRLQQILHNLIGNAIKFTDRGRIVVRPADEQPEGDWVAISVEDSGIGIPKEKQGSIFNSFEQVDASAEREAGGTGLGLSITRQLVELHGGRIYLTSEPGKGSVFTFLMPIADGGAEVEAGDALAYKPSVSRVVDQDIETNGVADSGAKNGEFKILVVDDEPVNQQVLHNHLTFARYTVTQALDGKAAMELLNSGNSYDLVLLDIMMPRMSGYEVCQKIRDIYLPSELPVIMITAKNQVADLVEGFSAGANDYLAKPISKNELLARIKTHLNLTQINDAYGKFVPHSFLRTLGRDSILDVKLGDHTDSEMNILFTDIRAYSTLSEGMTPEENFNFLTGYLRRVGPTISEHGGFVNQYYGDGFMALFSRSASDAVDAAIDMQRRVYQYNAERREKGREPIRIGVGLHTGHLMLGILGDETRMDPNVVSDAVNTASRMEGLTKHFGAPIIVSESTLEKLEDASKYNVRFLGKFQVKGKNQPLGVYEVADGESSDVVKLKMASKKEFELGLEHYVAREFEEASVSFRRVLKVNETDKAARRYLELSAKYMVEGVAEDWEGVEKLERK